MITTLRLINNCCLRLNKDDAFFKRFRRFQTVITRSKQGFFGKTRVVINEITLEILRYNLTIILR